MDNDTIQGTDAFRNETEPEPGRSLRPVLQRLRDEVADIEALAVVSGDGLPLAAVPAEGDDPDHFGTTCARLLALAEQTAAEVARGHLCQMLIECEEGTMLLVRGSPNAVLAIASRPSINLARIFISGRRTASEIATIVEQALTGRYR